jgi:hypothetical protein
MNERDKKVMELFEIATGGKWIATRWGKNDETPYTPDEIKALLCEMVDKTIKHGDFVPWFYGVHSSVDPDETPVSPVLTGMGPTSEVNAVYAAESRTGWPQDFYGRLVAERALEHMGKYLADSKCVLDFVGVINQFRNKALASLAAEGIKIEGMM